MKQKHWDYALGVIVGVLLLSVTTLVIMVAFDDLMKVQPEKKLKAAEALALVTVPGGHGSAAHLGNGVYITAAHVVADEPSVDLTVSPNTKLPAKVLWASTGFDVALVKVSLGNTQVDKLAIDCSSLRVGEEVVARGFPMNLGRTETRGTVGMTVSKPLGPWADATVLSVPVAGGMSGGPVLNKSTGKLRGITVGKFGEDTSPFLIAVPAATICTLMAKGEA